FVQASTSTNRNYGGTGLGLPIVKKLLEMFDSELVLESGLNQGTKMCFEIEFEYKETVTVLPQENPDKDKNLSQLRVLVAEDNEINVMVIRQTLKLWGIVPSIAYNGVEVLEQVNKNDFDVILMDLIMPVMDGYETAFAIRKLDDQAKSAVPIIAFSATIELDLMEKITDAGMNDFLSKPFSPDALLSKLSSLQVGNEGSN
ncbi:MAG: hybrid sensor histidine kinase/response regulator, partial [Chryseobacterium sp.]